MLVLVFLVFSALGIGDERRERAKESNSEEKKDTT